MQTKINKIKVTFTLTWMRLPTGKYGFLHEDSDDTSLQHPLIFVNNPQN